MRWRLSTPGSAEYILPVTLSTSVTPISPYKRHRSLMMYFIERVWDALGAVDRVNSEMHWEAVIERVWRCTWRPWSCKPAGCDRVSLEIHMEAVIERVWRYTGRPRLCELAHRNRASLEIHLEAAIERVWTCTGGLWSSEIGGVRGGGRLGGSRDGSWDPIHWLTCNCGNVESWLQHPPRDEKLAGHRRLSILGWCCTWCMLYSVLTHDYGMER